jgi:hypothetical protein
MEANALASDSLIQACTALLNLSFLIGAMVTLQKTWNCLHRRMRNSAARPLDRFACSVYRIVPFRLWLKKASFYFSLAEGLKHTKKH